MDLPWFKVYVAETLSDERFQSWSIDERGAWFTLICVAWREGSIPSDQTSLARLLHLDAGTMRGIWSAIGSRFVPHPDREGRLTSPRLEIERERAMEQQKRRSKAGTTGANSRWEKEKQKHAKRMANAKQSDATVVRLDGTQDKAAQDRQ